MCIFFSFLYFFRGDLECAFSLFMSMLLLFYSTFYHTHFVLFQLFYMARFRFNPDGCVLGGGSKVVFCI